MQLCGAALEEDVRFDLIAVEFSYLLFVYLWDNANPVVDDFLFEVFQGGDLFVQKIFYD